MVRMNDKMNKILNNDRPMELSMQIDAMLTEIVNRTKIIKDCIIYDEEGTLKEENVKLDRILRFVGDLTGYEVSCNEIRFNRNDVSQSQYLMVAYKLNSKLGTKYTGKKIVTYISEFDSEIELRFHTYRENEGSWLNDNLNKYDVPILCCM